MKTQLIPLMLFCSGLTLVAAGKKSTTAHGLREADSVVWAGLDYSMVRMYGTRDFYETNKIFPEMFDRWNVMCVRERWSERVGMILGKRVIVDIGGMTEQNKLAKSDQVIREDGTGKLLAATHITDADVANAVRSCQLTEKSGLGLVFIVDRLVKRAQKGCLYIVFFDVESRKVLASRRGTYRAHGGGFRNYWFRPVKEAIRDVKKVIKEAK